MYLRKGELVRAVREVLEENPHWVTAMIYDIVNYSALARKIKPILEKRLGQQLKHNSIVKAIIVFSEKLKKESKKVLSTLNQASFSVNSSKNLHYTLNEKGELKSIRISDTREKRGVTEIIVTGFKNKLFFKKHFIPQILAKDVDLKLFIDQGDKLLFYVDHKDAWKILKILAT
ncbi:MAG: hypothetical protein J7L38_00630 [Thermoproteales archaeon]|nr:hypothetical protein [Thermoproteales archaeon]